MSSGNCGQATVAELQLQPLAFGDLAGARQDRALGVSNRHETALQRRVITVTLQKAPKLAQGRIAIALPSLESSGETLTSLETPQVLGPLRHLAAGQTRQATGNLRQIPTAATDLARQRRFQTLATIR